jgi:hypothetical protein
MRISWKASLLALFIVIGLFLYIGGPYESGLGRFFFPPSSSNSNEDDAVKIGSNSTPSNLDDPQIDTSNADPRFTRFLDGTVHWQASLRTSRQLHQSPDPREDLHLIEQLLSDYRLVYRENPVGSENAEIIAALLGDNPKKVFFIDPALSSLNDQNELLDRWGSPYILHPIKADLMDIRSIGPDKIPWTKDDLSLNLTDAENELGLTEDEKKSPE